MEEFDPGVKEASAWALGYIARHSAGYISIMQSVSCDDHVPDRSESGGGG